MKKSNSISLTGRQLLDALSLITGDGLRRDLTTDELETSIDIAAMGPWRDNESKKEQPAGLYASLSEDQQEGLYGPLGDTHESERIEIAANALPDPLPPERIDFLLSYADKEPGLRDDELAMKQLALAVRQLRGDCEVLRCALRRARDWGLQAKGFEIRASHDLAKWIDSGMERPLPKLPEPLDEFEDPQGKS